ncbi:MAG: DUF302 domain-containing protein [Gammaproteobacteria bacterium]|nr:DUF302 domain-containing protein [Gammaproteobacteria bacterium]
MDRVRQALMAQQLGIVSEIDVQSVFKQKMAKDIPPYRILGACNPKLADRVLAAEPNAGALLPCNLVVRDSGKNSTVVSFMDPVAVMGLSASTEVNAVAQEAKDKLLLVLDSLKAV